MLTSATGEATRYEQIMAAHSARPGDLAARFARASRAARAAVEAASEHEAAIRDVAAGVAGPALVGFVLWIQEQARQRGLRRLRFLSRDGQVLYELTRRLASGLDLEYVYCSRLTWSFAATQPGRLAEAPWLFNSFIKSNAADVCARLGLAFAQYRPIMLACGVSLDPEARADQPVQAQALLRFIGLPEVTRAVEARIAAMRGLVVDYAAQHALAEADTGLVDIGWTGRMAASLIHVCEAAGMARPHILFWGHEPRPATGWTDPERVGSYVYNTATGHGLGWRVPDAPFVMETFCMGDHGIVSGYRRDADGRVEPVLQSPGNDAAEAWGLRLYRLTLYAFCAALEMDRRLSEDDVRPLVHQVLEAFWCHPDLAEARAWGAYPYDSDPAGTAVRPLARPFDGEGRVVRGDRAWLAGSLALSTAEGRAAYLRQAPEHELAGAPETDLPIWTRRLASAVLAIRGSRYWPVAALNLTTSSAGTRPRSFTSMPCALAHSRTSVVFKPFADPLRPPRAGRLAVPPARRAAPT